MRIRQINLDDDGLPERITAELTRDEALYITTFLGQQTHGSANEVMSGGADVGNDMYDTLTGGLFDLYWNDGAAGALRSRGESA